MGTTHIPSNRHPRKGSPRAQSQNTNQHSSCGRLQHSNLPPSLRTPSMVTARSSQPTQPTAKHRRAGPHYNTDTTRTLCRGVVVQVHEDRVFPMIMRVSIVHLATQRGCLLCSGFGVHDCISCGGLVYASMDVADVGVCVVPRELLRSLLLFFTFLALATHDGLIRTVLHSSTESSCHIRMLSRTC